MSQTDALQTWIDERADEMAALLMDLVAMNTENPPGRGLGDCARALHDAMQRLGFATELILIPPSGTLEDPCILRARLATVLQSSTSTGTMTSFRRRAQRSSSRAVRTATSSGAAPPT